MFEYEWWKREKENGNGRGVSVHGVDAERARESKRCLYVTGEGTRERVYVYLLYRHFACRQEEKIDAEAKNKVREGG